MTKANPKLQLQTLKEVVVCSQYASINARLNSKATNRIKYVEIPDDSTLSTIDNKVEAAKYIIDKLLPRDTDARNFYVVSFTKQTNNMMIAQKLDYNKGYASFILFGYGFDTMVYCAKSDGIWTIK